MLRDLGYLTIDEPFTNLLTQGMVIKDGAKMSKSKGNVVDPNELIERYGADTVRLFSLFAAPPERDLEWNAQGVEGASRFLNRIYRLVYRHLDCFQTSKPLDMTALNEASRKLHRKTHQTIRRVTENIETNFHFNTAISGVMELVNLAVAQSGEEDDIDPAVQQETLETILTLLFPMVPHFCEELWQVSGHRQLLSSIAWPDYDREAAREEEILIVVQVNGKMRAKLSMPADTEEQTLQQAALNDPKIAQLLENKEPKKIIVVQGKLVNIVI
jgi:leucyl-tRNA synthetase